MKIKVKAIGLSTGGPLIAVLTKKDAKEFDLSALDRLRIKKKNGPEIVANLDISTGGIKTGYIGLFSETLERLSVRDNYYVDIEPAPRPKSIEIIRKKLDGHRLNEEDLKILVSDIFHDRLSEVELTYFVAGAYTKGFNLEESSLLTKIIVKEGYSLKLENKYILDKHCVGGVPGNRTTMIIVPIIASLGYTIPKTSSRSITSPAGTADVMEVLAPVLIDHKRLEKVVKKTNGCMIWQSSMNPHGADEKLIKVRHPLSLDPEGLLLSSVMAKKKAVGATHVLIDIPCGEGAKFSYHAGKKLKKKFVAMGRKLGMKVKVIITDGSQPIGNGIGPALEARDVLAVLQGKGPEDLKNKAVFMATELLKMIGIRRARKKVEYSIYSGKAYKKMMEIIKAQGGSTRIVLPKAKYVHEVKAARPGEVKSINNKLIAKIARVAGSPEDKSAGIDLYIRKDTKVEKGDVLFKVYSNSKNRIEFAKAIIKECERYTNECKKVVVLRP